MVAPTYLFSICFYIGQRVLVVGSGSSGIDIAHMLTDVCPEVYLANHVPFGGDAVLPANLFLCADLQKINETGGTFQDNSTCSVDTILYCTGFKYSYPFLNEECGIFVKDNHVQPLFKHLINIEHPTMAFIGLNFQMCAQILFDLQCRFCVKFWTSGKPFPRREEMLADEARDLEARLRIGWKQRHAHRLAINFMPDYHRQLATLADIPGIPNVYAKIYDETMRSLRNNYAHFRKDKYVIVDEESFVKV